MIAYTDSIEGVSADKLQGFFVGWPDPPSPTTHLRTLEKSDYVVLALDGDTGEVVGFVTAISDGVLSAYIPLLEVLPDYQGRGIGRELLRRVLEKLKGLYQVALLCDQETQAFYARLGMKPVPGMIIRDADRQSGE